MITRLRGADADEVEFFALVAAEAGVACLPQHRPDVVRVAILDGQVAGFVAATLPVDDDADAVLDYLFVHGDRRGRGVGRALLDDLCRASSLIGAGGVTIVAHPASAGFFDRTAAVRVGTRAPDADVPWSSPVYRMAGEAALAACALPVGAGQPAS